MQIYSVNDLEFKEYGRVVEGYDTTTLQEALQNHTPLTDAVEYVPSELALESLAIANTLQTNEFGGMPMQLGWCNGVNSKLNCLEYHRDSEFNLGSTDFILLLARLQEVENGVLDTAKVKAFLCPKGTLIEVYATTLHYAPCSVTAGQGFRVMVGLPRGTNTAKPALTVVNDENKLLWACNKWLLAHESSTEAQQGAYIGLVGTNIDLSVQ